MAEPGTRFVVKRLNWSDEYGEGLLRRPGEVAVASFATFEEAEAERAKREEDFRKAVNPFECGKAVHAWTHLDEPRLRDWLMDHGITPPDPNKDGTTNWPAWWKKNQKKLGAEKRAAVWEVLDKVRFFAVREEPVRAVGYAVVGVDWRYNDQYYDAGEDGCEVITVYRSRERAEEQCAWLNADARDQWDEVLGDQTIPDDVDPNDEYDYVLFDMQDRLRRRQGLKPGEKLKKGEGLFQTTEGVPFYEVIEVELESLQ
jgi:hypothetical protein